ncbi:hypothetical protein AB0K93_14460 [Streptomyces sp. NPDC052676]|uniref:hypothetical protein n=1 Tax=Streptomyces sp. NPDC052676 TaxID=3154953 RepID=UPI00343E4656
MTVDQLPDRVREFADYLGGLLARLDQDSGWCAVFWQRDPDGMRACLDGHEVPPWDVVESLLQDLAAEHGPEAAAPEKDRARALHAAALAAYDALPGGRDALGDRLDVMLREQKYAAERLAELGRSLAAAPTREAAEALRLDLAWARDDHDRATARCTELRARMARWEGSSWPGGWRDGEPWPTAGPGGGLRPTAGPGGGQGSVGESGGPWSAPDAVGESGGGLRPAGESGGGPWSAPGAGGGSGSVGESGGGLRPTAGPGGGQGSVGESGGPWSAPDAVGESGGGLRPTAGPDGGPGSAGEPGGGLRSADAAAVAPAPARPGPAAPGPATRNPVTPAPAAAPAPPATTPGPSATATTPTATPTTPAPPAPTPAPKPRRRRRGSARFAGIGEDGDGPVVVPAVSQAVPVVPVARGGRTPRGARFAGAGEETLVVEAPPSEPVDAEARREAGAVVEALARLRAEGRSGEAHALLVEAARWPAARFPLLAAEMERAGLAADWATLLWETASLPADRLVAAADALTAAGRDADGQQILRQGVVRPAAEIGQAVLALTAEGRRREADALLDAYVRVRTPEEAVRSAAPAPQTLVPLLLQAAARVSPERHRDLAHALRVAGLPT